MKRLVGPRQKLAAADDQSLEVPVRPALSTRGTKHAARKKEPAKALHSQCRSSSRVATFGKVRKGVLATSRHDSVLFYSGWGFPTQLAPCRPTAACRCEAVQSRSRNAASRRSRRHSNTLCGRRGHGEVTSGSWLAPWPVGLSVCRPVGLPGRGQDRTGQGILFRVGLHGPEMAEA